MELVGIVIGCGPFIAAVGFFIYRMIRRSIRLRRRERGLCEKCGYNVTGVKYHCPECGTLVER